MSSFRRKFLEGGAQGRETVGKELRQQHLGNGEGGDLEPPLRPEAPTGSPQGWLSFSWEAWEFLWVGNWWSV